MINTSEEERQISERRKKKVSSILVSQPKPKNPNSPYLKLADKYGLKIDFRPFIKIDPVTLKEFRQQKIDVLAHSAVIFTSRNAVDHFFRLCSESKIEVPADMKYFCISEQTANYLQKYIVIRKRKIFTGSRTAADLIEMNNKLIRSKSLNDCNRFERDLMERMLLRS